MITVERVGDVVMVDADVDGLHAQLTVQAAMWDGLDGHESRQIRTMRDLLHAVAGRAVTELRQGVDKVVAARSGAEFAADLIALELIEERVFEEDGSIYRRLRHPNGATATEIVGHAEFEGQRIERSMRQWDGGYDQPSRKSVGPLPARVVRYVEVEPSPPLPPSPGQPDRWLEDARRWAASTETDLDPVAKVLRDRERAAVAIAERARLDEVRRRELLRQHAIALAEWRARRALGRMRNLPGFAGDEPAPPIFRPTPAHEVTA